MKNLAHGASFHLGEKTAPSKPRTMHLPYRLVATHHPLDNTICHSCNLCLTRKAPAKVSRCTATSDEIARLSRQAFLPPML